MDATWAEGGACGVFLPVHTLAPVLAKNVPSGQAVHHDTIDIHAHAPHSVSETTNIVPMEAGICADGQY